MTCDSLTWSRAPHHTQGVSSLSSPDVPRPSRHGPLPWTPRAGCHARPRIPTGVALSPHRCPERGAGAGASGSLCLSAEAPGEALTPLPCPLQYLLSPETIDALRKPTFDVWLWEPNEVSEGAARGRTGLRDQWGGGRWLFSASPCSSFTFNLTPGLHLGCPWGPRGCEKGAWHPALALQGALPPPPQQPLHPDSRRLPVPPSPPGAGLPGTGESFQNWFC